MKACFALPLRLILPCESRAMEMDTVRGLVAGIIVVVVKTGVVEVVLTVSVLGVVELVGYAVDLVPGADRSCARTTVPSFRV